jgi:hypothetical protein
MKKNSRLKIDAQASGDPKATAAAAFIDFSYSR